ncbi:hypothetical protein FZEAL_9566 [Fusarium zealandicum]|uniref:Fun14 family protein n=1 Tax=Fusarium zealandicum TaxID=1053134 RepID=A0A8H4UAX9_9HYPO|nr:hypothetical protein FZEAL_9566 [Fusarium zealandicum]
MNAAAGHGALGSAQKAFSFGISKTTQFRRGSTEMYRTFNSRVAYRAMAAGLGPTACVGAFVATRPVIRCDAPTLATGPPRRRQPSLDVSPNTVRQISSGSVAGFGVGVVVALFSRTLAILSGLVALSIHIASRYGLDIPRTLGVKKFLERNSVWTRSKRNPVFTASFLVTFILAAFVRL